jgi:hypothetical protein
MFKWMSAAFVALAGLSFNACAGVASDDKEAQLETSSGDLIARMCRRDGDCLAPALCRECPDGVSFSCAQATCDSGRCGVLFPPCPEPEPPPEPGLIFCGGIAGFQCPSGFECVDDPRDDCSPCRGGADCGGICVELSCKQACDPTLICTQALTCVGGQLYPSGCGPRNCDAPIGECAATQ